MPDFPTVQYSQVIDQLQTGDLVLFSGATSSGALIKIFDGAIFSHIGIVRFSRSFEFPGLFCSIPLLSHVQKLHLLELMFVNSSKETLVCSD